MKARMFVGVVLAAILMGCAASQTASQVAESTSSVTATEAAEPIDVAVGELRPQSPLNVPPCLRDGTCGVDTAFFLVSRAAEGRRYWPYEGFDMMIALARLYQQAVSRGERPPSSHLCATSIALRQAARYYCSDLNEGRGVPLDECQRSSEPQALREAGTTVAALIPESDLREMLGGGCD